MWGISILVAEIMLFLLILVIIGYLDERSQKSDRSKINMGLNNQWKVDKQVVIQTGSSSYYSAPSSSEQIYRPSPAMGIVKAGADQKFAIYDISTPRVVRVCIVNKSQTQVALIGETELDNEDRIQELIAEAENRCSFLNAHGVK